MDANDTSDVNPGELGDLSSLVASYQESEYLDPYEPEVDDDWTDNLLPRPDRVRSVSHPIHRPVA